MIVRRCHFVKNDRIRSFSGPYFPAFGLNTERYREKLRISPYSVRMRENTDQKNSKYGHFPHSVLKGRGNIMVKKVVFQMFK